MKKLSRAFLAACLFTAIAAWAASPPPDRAGLGSNQAETVSLMQRAAHNPGNAGTLLEEALRKSPDFPPVYFRLAGYNLLKNPLSFYDWSYYFVEGFRAYGRSWWWWLDLSGLCSYCLLVSFVLALLVTVLIRLPKEFPLLKHDINEDRSLLFLPGVLLAAAFMGPVLFLGTALLLLGFYFSKKNRLLVYFVLILIAVLPYLENWVNTVYSSSNPELRAIVAVNEGSDNSLALDALSGRKDFESLFSRGLALEREGRLDEAIASYGAAMELRKDPRIFVNLGNCYVLEGNTDKARGLYENALEIRPGAPAYYNLSTLYRDSLDYTRGDELYARAANINPAGLSAFLKSDEQSGGKLLMDERLGVGDFMRVLEKGHERKLTSSGIPSGVSSLAAILLLVFFFIYNRRRRARAYRCSRCSKILCPICEREPKWGQMCKECYSSFVKLEVVDPKERVSRLLMIHGYQLKREALIRALGFAPPGIAHIYAGEVMLGMFLLWGFVFSLLLYRLNPYFTTGLSGMGHGWLGVLGASGAVFFYLVSFFSIRKGVGQRWL